MELVNQKLVCRLTKDSEWFETTFRKVLRILGNDDIRARHNRSCEHMSVVFVRNAFGRSPVTNNLY
jgi:hypothetical protein